MSMMYCRPELLIDVSSSPVKQKVENNLYWILIILLIFRGGTLWIKKKKLQIYSMWQRKELKVPIVEG